eukprot:4814973-Amphidinium_carterae.1
MPVESTSYDEGGKSRSDLVHLHHVMPTACDTHCYSFPCSRILDESLHRSQRRQPRESNR